MTNRHPTIQSEEEEKQQHGDFHRHLHGHHLKAILVMLGFTVAQFFFIAAIVDAGELTIKALLGCTNQIRLSFHQPNELAMNDKLTVAAEKKLKDMAEYKYWAHQNPITGKQPWDFVDAAGYYYETTGENLAYGFNDSEKICNAWESSPKHLANITNPTYEEIGFAVDKANLHKNEKGILVVQMFGSRNDFSATNHAAAESSSGSTFSTGQTQQASVPPRVEGASTSKNTAYDSVHPQSLDLWTIFGTGAIVSFITIFVLTFFIFRFKKNKKKVKMIRAAAIGFALVTAILGLLFFLNPPL